MVDILDSGPIYKETYVGEWPLVEPWNALSNLLFLAIVLFWAVRVYKHAAQHAFLAGALPVLFIGFVGGTLYHGTRSHEVWLLMDWVPIMLLSLAVSVYFAIQNRFRWYGTLALITFPFAISALAWQADSLPQWARGLLGYPMMAFVILFPIVFYLNKHQWRHVQWVATALAMFIIAITCRSIDNGPYDGLPMGTHWLWHIFGALASHFLIAYIYKERRHQIGAFKPA